MSALGEAGFFFFCYRTISRSTNNIFCKTLCKTTLSMSTSEYLDSAPWFLARGVIKERPDPADPDVAVLDPQVLNAAIDDIEAQIATATATLPTAWTVEDAAVCH